MCRKLFVLAFFILCAEILAKDEKSNASAELKSTVNKMLHNDAPALLFADELKQIFERYLFGICPQTQSFKITSKKNATITCDLDADHQDLAGRLATLALRVHTVSRTECTRFGAALANTLGELARTASNRQVSAAAAIDKKRKLSKSQKAKIAAKQRTALAVKKKAAAVAAAAAAKMATPTP